jgi:hypothetical protein
MRGLIIRKQIIRELLAADETNFAKVLQEHSNYVTGKIRRYNNFNSKHLNRIRHYYLNIMTEGKMRLDNIIKG